MKILLENVSYYPAKYCITSVLGSYLKYYGIDLYADLLGEIWDFEFSVFPNGTLCQLPEVRIRPLRHHVLDILSCGYGVKMQPETITNDKELITNTMKALSEGLPVIVSADPYYFGHYENYLKYHGLKWNHYIIVYGIDMSRKEVFYNDSTRAFCGGCSHTFSFEEFVAAVFPRPNIYATVPEFYTMVLDQKAQLDKAGCFKTEWSAREGSGQYILKAYGKNGLESLLEFAAYAALIKSDVLQDEIITSCLNQIVLMAQHRKGNYTFLMKKGDTRSVKILRIVGQWEKMKYCMSPLRKKHYLERMNTFRTYLEEVIEMEREVYDELRSGEHYYISEAYCEPQSYGTAEYYRVY